MDVELEEAIPHHLAEAEVDSCQGEPYRVLTIAWDVRGQPARQSRVLTLAEALEWLQEPPEDVEVVGIEPA